MSRNDGGRSRKSLKGGRSRGKSGRRISTECVNGMGRREKGIRGKKSEIKRKRKMESRGEKSRSRKSNSRNYRSKYDVDERLEYYMTRKLGKGSYATVYLGILFYKFCDL